MIKFLKMNGAGNDFVIIDARQNDQQFLPTQIAKIADRKNIGCDQFIILKNSSSADILMEIYNADGSKAGACGNATRCVASLIIKEKGKNQILVETTAGILSCRQESDNLISVNMGKIRFSWQEIPLSQELDTNSFTISSPQFLQKYQFCAANIGNPHLVSFLDKEITDEEFFHIGPILENHSLFPQKINVEFAKIIGPNHIKVRVWERGAGETLACGSGACAVAVLAIRKNLLANQKIKISFKGGDLFIDWREDGSVIMIGGYEKIFSGIIEENFLNSSFPISNF